MAAKKAAAKKAPAKKAAAKKAPAKKAAAKKAPAKKAAAKKAPAKKAAAAAKKAAGQEGRRPRRPPKKARRRRQQPRRSDPSTYESKTERESGGRHALRSSVFRSDASMRSICDDSLPSTTISTVSSSGLSDTQWLARHAVTRMGDSRSDQSSVVLRSAGADGADRSRWRSPPTRSG